MKKYTLEEIKKALPDKEELLGDHNGPSYNYFLGWNDFREEFLINLNKTHVKKENRTRGS